jgi:hypothetical protein
MGRRAERPVALDMARRRPPSRVRCRLATQAVRRVAPVPAAGLPAAHRATRWVVRFGPVQRSASLSQCPRKRLVRPVGPRPCFGAADRARQQRMQATENGATAWRLAAAALAAGRLEVAGAGEAKEAQRPPAMADLVRMSPAMNWIAARSPATALEQRHATPADGFVPCRRAVDRPHSPPSPHPSCAPVPTHSHALRMLADFRRDAHDYSRRGRKSASGMRSKYGERVNGSTALVPVLRNRRQVAIRTFV